MFRLKYTLQLTRLVGIWNTTLPPLSEIHWLKIWKFKHVGCVTTSEIEAALEHYQTVEGIPTLLVKPGQSDIPHERRQECNQLLSCILEVLIVPLSVRVGYIIGCRIQEFTGTGSFTERPPEALRGFDRLVGHSQPHYSSTEGFRICEARCPTQPCA